MHLSEGAVDLFVNITANMLDSEVKQNVVVAKNADTMLKQESVDALSPQVLEAYRKIAARNAIIDFELTVQPIGGKGENSYGSVLKVCLTPTQTSSGQSSATPLHTILKMAPTSQARRIHMRVKDVYAREVFMYAEVFSEFEALSVLLNNNNNNNNNNKVDASAYQMHFNVTPQMLHSSLADDTEFIIFEDLTTAGYTINSRVNLPTYDLVVCAFRAIAQLHAMSFVLQARQPQRFAALVTQMDDNLFTADMEVVSIEFGKKSVRRTRQMFESDLRLAMWIRHK
ncbi:unnamed protein product [Ceratitis capitata]|nr:unnamed protein product [Ceratitis capitata]